MEQARACKRLFADIEAGPHRLRGWSTRWTASAAALLDFAQMMQTFDKHRVSFVSVTQQFNTATSMGGWC
jgi:site-specific DNA recombinase